MARRWNLDPRPVTSISPFATFEGNPITCVDPLGDTTIYAVASYDQERILFKSNDGLENAVVLFKDEETFNRYVQENAIADPHQNSLEGNPNIMHSDDFNRGLRKLSLNYMYDDMKKLYTANKTLIASQGDVPENRLIVDKLENGKKVKYPPELATHLVLDGNEVRILTFDASSEDVKNNDHPGYIILPTPPPHIHTHPIVYTTIFRRMPDGTYPVEKGSNPPSGADWGQIATEKPTVFSVIATPTHFWFYNVNKEGEHISIKIDY